MKDIFSSPMFGIVLCIFTYKAALYVNQKLKTPLANPLVIAISFIIIILKVFNISLADFQQGGDIISMFLAPATVALALSIYRQIKVLKKYFLPIIAGCFVGCITSMSSVYFLCKLFKLDEKIIASMLSKSVTTPIAIEITNQLGGIAPITVAAVIVTGIMGAVLAPTLIKFFHIDNSIAAGVAIGASSHAVGTSKAIEIGEIEGAMSGVSIVVSGIITVILSIFI